MHSAQTSYHGRVKRIFVEYRLSSMPFGWDQRQPSGSANGSGSHCSEKLARLEHEVGRPEPFVLPLNVEYRTTSAFTDVT